MSVKESKKERNSNIELFRIILMIFLVASHYVHNSGILECKLMETGGVTPRNTFIALFGMWGKPIINCFLFITGYFMCKSKINISKYVKTLFQVLFYDIGIYVVFLICGYSKFSYIEFFYSVIPIKSIKTDFVSCYLVFYLLIPFINILLSNLNSKSHFFLMSILVFTYSILGTVPKIDVRINYVTWFTVIYIIASYFRFYKNELLKNRKVWVISFIISYILSILSIIAGLYIRSKYNINMIYFLLEDSNKVLAVIIAFSAFIIFLNLNVKQSRIINTISKATFGVLLIHANSDTMRKWLWSDTLKCTDYFNTNYYIIHAVLSVLLVYIVCVLIELVRINVFDKIIDKSVLRISNKIEKYIKVGNTNE